MVDRGQGGHQRQRQQSRPGKDHPPLGQKTGGKLILLFLIGKLNFGFQGVVDPEGQGKDHRTKEEKIASCRDLPAAVEIGFAGQQVEVADIIFKSVVIGIFSKALYQYFHGLTFKRIIPAHLPVVEQQQQGYGHAEDPGDHRRIPRQLQTVPYVHLNHD